MKITNAALYAGEVRLASFSLGLGESEDHYLIKAMSGIDADQLIPRFYAFGESSGFGMFDVGMPARDIVIRIVLNPSIVLDESFSELRDILYRSIASSRNPMLRLEFSNGGSKISDISGFMTKFEAGLFSQVPEVQLTIHCDDPFFRGVVSTTYEPDELAASFVIPDSLSTAPHGFAMQVEFNASLDSFAIQDSTPSPEWVFTVTPPGGFD